MKAVHSNDTGDVFVFRPTLGVQENKSYLYHENLHNAICGVFGTDYPNEVESIFSYIYNRNKENREEMDRTIERYKKNGCDINEQHEEAIVWYLQKKVPLTDESIEILANSSSIEEQKVGKLLEFIKYGTVEGKPARRYRGVLGRNISVGQHDQENREDAGGRKNEGGNNSHVSKKDSKADGLFRKALKDQSGSIIFDNNDPEITVAEKEVGAVYLVPPPVFCTQSESVLPR